jgi:hypothetical protein
MQNTYSCRLHPLSFGSHLDEQEWEEQCLTVLNVQSTWHNSVRLGPTGTNEDFTKRVLKKGLEGPFVH